MHRVSWGRSSAAVVSSIDDVSHQDSAASPPVPLFGPPNHSPKTEARLVGGNGGGDTAII